jgi:hypothetical protein
LFSLASSDIAIGELHFDLSWKRNLTGQAGRQAGRVL